jgi:radical SAM superfamily enzyme YgiQ (UPF0313 family)
MKLMKTDDWPLIRFIIPAFPRTNIYTSIAGKTTSLGPIMAATAASKVWGWRVEVIDENNYSGPKDKNGLPDHAKLQAESPASVAGFYCGLTSTMDRIFELAKFYQGQGAINLAGSWHAHYCPEEVLNGYIDIIIHGDAETAIQQILLSLQKGESISDIPGISFWENGRQKSNLPKMLEIENLDELPYPDFGLLRYAKIKLYPIGRTRGCGMNCEFCSVKGEVRSASAGHLFNTVNWLVEQRGANYFFIVDDRLEENLPGTIEFFRLISEKYGNSLNFGVQIRLEAAKNMEFIEAMRKAGVRVVNVGYESPIDEDLFAMRKGYNSKNMIEWTKILRRNFWVHGMFIFGYPHKKKSELSPDETAELFRKFIRKAKIGTIQIMHPVPIVGTDLRARLAAEGRLFPLDVLPWDKYDGNWTCFKPDNMSMKELQEIPINLMGRFYNGVNALKFWLRTIAFPFDWVIRGGWRRWHHLRQGWLKDLAKYEGHRLLKRWRKEENEELFLKRLEEYKKQRNGTFSV